MTFDRAAYLARVQRAVHAGIENQRKRIDRGEVRDPRKPERVKQPGELPTEWHEQRAVVQWLRAKQLTHFAVPNGGKRGAIEGNYLKHIGVTAGVPDLLILEAPPKYPGAKGVALEMKRQGNAKPTEAQEWWLLRMSSRGWCTYVAHGADDAIDWLSNSLGWT